MQNPQKAHPFLLLVLFLGVFTAALDIAILGPALRRLAEAFSIDERAVSWVFILFTLFGLVGLPIAASLADRYGRSLVFTGCILTFAVGTCVVLMASSFDGVLVGRCIQGLGTSGILPITSAVIGDVIPLERRGRALGLIGAVFGLAFLIGPILGGILIQYGWRWLFAVSLPVALATGLAAPRVLPRARRRPRPIDPVGIGFLAGALAGFTYGINQLDVSSGEAGGLPLGAGLALVGSVLGFAGFYWRERKGEAPFLPPALIRRRRVWMAGMIAAGSGAAEAAFVFFPSFVVAAFGVADRTASFMLLPLVGAMFIGSPVAGRILDRVGTARMVTGGALLVTLGLGVLGLVADRTAYFAGTVLVGLGLAVLLGSALSYVMLEEAAEADRTVAQGFLRIAKGIGRLVGGAWLGAVIGSLGGAPEGYLRAFLSVAAGMAVLTLVSYYLARTSGHPAAAVESTRSRLDPVE